MFLIEIKRAFSRVSFKIAILIGILFSIVSLIKGPIYKGDILNSYINGFVHTPFDEFIVFKYNPISDLLLIIMPIISTLSYSDSYIEDEKSGLIKSIYTRHKKHSYLLSKYCANFVVSGFAFSIPLLLNYVSLILLYPSVQSDRMFGYSTIGVGGLYSELFYGHGNLYIIMWIVIYFLYSGAFASIALCVSKLIKNKFVVLFIPFILAIIVEIFTEIFHKVKYSPTHFLYISVDQDFSIILLEFILIFVITISFFCFGGFNNEDY
jgi:ABC-type transport system involved in multi-copper enzyme maturation permease subunit